jgi:hypothetical protein
LASSRIAGRCYGVIRAGEPNSVLEARLRDYNMMIYHVSFGDVAEGLHCASRLLPYCLNEDHTANDLSLVFNVGFALRVCGHTDEAIAVMQRSFDRASTLGLPNKKASPAWQLAAMYFDRQEDEPLMIWRNIVIGIRNSSPAAPSLSHLDGFLFRVAAFERDLSSVKFHYEALIAGSSCTPTTRAKCFYEACELTLGLLDSSWVPTDSSVASLAYSIQRTPSMLFADFMASTAVSGFLRLSQLDRAEEFLGNYTHRVRREVGPPGPELKRILQESPLVLRAQHF